MVLGILSVMVIMAVAFAISMRTERVAAGNYADSVRARQLVQVGLARALDDLAGKLGTNGFWSTTAGGIVVSGTNYPPWTVTNSYTTTYTNTATNATLLKLLALKSRDNEATNFVPRALWAVATNADYYSTTTYTNAAHHWLPIESIITTNYDGKKWTNEYHLMGRVKYLILNCSGLLDANFAGGAIRGVGTNPTEIAIDKLNEIDNPANADSFVTNRRYYVRYETLHELKELNPFVYFNEMYPSNLFIYSRALPGYWKINVDSALNCVDRQANLNGSAADLSSRMSEITNAFASAGFSLIESGVLYSNLIDYVDADSIPSNFEYCVENVPMINEVVVSNAIEVSDGSDAGHKNYKVTTDIYIECWYPFVKSAVASFNLNVTNKFSGTPGFQHADGYNDIPVTSSSWSTPVRYRCFHGEKGPFELSLENLITLTTTIDPKVQLGVNNVDVLKNPIVLSTTHVGSGAIPRDNQAVSFECLDPRVNYDPADLNLWRPRTPFSPADVPNSDNNPWVAEWWPAHTAGDVDAAMHVADGPLLSVAELGYLVYTNMPWRTVKLYGPDCHRVLDVFAIGTNASYIYVTNTIWRGRVNPNTTNNDALVAAFYNIPVNNSTNDASPDTLLLPDTIAIAEHIQANAQTYGFYTNLSDLGRWFNPVKFPSYADNELKKEAIFRNTCGLLSVRQNLFTIIIEAQVASGGNIPRNPVKQRAVALVWRDPYTGEMFVRSIKWLRD